MTKEIRSRRFNDNHNAYRKVGSLAVFLLCSVLFPMAIKESSAFLRIVNRPLKCTAKVPALREHQCQSTATLYTTPENDALYIELNEEIKSIAKELWGNTEIPTTSNDKTTPKDEHVSLLFEGEAGLPEDLPFSERGDHFRREALRGCPYAQHSYGLLLWSGFAGVEQNPEESAKFHAAAACQHHLDGMAVFGGCLRTGTGIPKSKKTKKSSPTTHQTTNTIALGLKVIDFCASRSIGNPTGVNKQAAMNESNGDDFRAVELYEACLRNGRANALLRFNLGWCLVNGRGVDQRNRDRGISLWKEATEQAPDEGSEEAAWNLYQEYERDDPKEAQRWLDLVEELGYCE